MDADERRRAGEGRPRRVFAARRSESGRGPRARVAAVRLIGMTEMDPAPHRGHKVLVKGLLIKDATGQRINVTSLKTVGDTCGK